MNILTRSTLATTISCLAALDSGCANYNRVSSGVATHIIKAADLIDHATDYDRQVLCVSGCLVQSASGAVHMHPCESEGENARKYIDVVGHDKLLSSRLPRSTVHGEFRAYSSDFVGGGNLTSSIGLLKVDGAWNRDCNRLVNRLEELIREPTLPHPQLELLENGWQRYGLVTFAPLVTTTAAQTKQHLYGQDYSQKAG